MKSKSKQAITKIVIYLFIIVLCTVGVIGVIQLIQYADKKEPLVRIENRVDMLNDHEQRITYLEENCKCGE